MRKITQELITALMKLEAYWTKDHELRYAKLYADYMSWYEWQYSEHIMLPLYFHAHDLFYALASDDIRASHFEDTEDGLLCSCLDCSSRILDAVDKVLYYSGTKYYNPDHFTLEEALALDVTCPHQLSLL